MHQPNTTKRPSVFYDYQIFPFVRPPEMDGNGEPRQVVIVGAGPIGLVLSLLLAKWGVPSVILEAEAQVSEGSRAAAFTRRSQEILQQAGAVQPFLDNGLEWNTGRAFYKGKQIHHMVIPYDENDRFKPVLNNSQQYWEEYLIGFCEQSDLIDLRWQSKFVALKDEEDGVTVTVDTPEGEYQIKTNWLVAADGGRSQVRHFMGLRMDGVGFEGKFVITDFRAPNMNMPTERKVFFDPDWAKGNNILVHRQPNDLWRFDYRVPDGEDPAVSLAPETITKRIELIMEMLDRDVEWELDWATIYSANTKTLTDYRHGHVLFAGDAAHLLPVFGVRGANTGLQDAENLAWQLALVETKGASTALLDNFSRERVKSAYEICEEAGKSTRVMDPPTRGYRLMRNVLLSFALTEDFCRELLDWRTSRPHEYLDSPINALSDDNDRFVAGPRNGTVARSVKLADDHYLFDDFTFRFQLLVFTKPGGTVPSLDGLQNRDLLNVIAVGASVDGADVSLTEGADAVFEKFGIGAEGMYLLRPDMHVCGRWQSIDIDTINAEITRILKGSAK
jgi:3-(3-hydroxy-phenyl)propionate hydroxylase|tara:strand:+ start:3959 stop:5638 length:1680 start_codon:yes stop_codon:yes gene_type:complete